MSTYDFSVSTKVLKGGAPMLTQQPTTWHGLDDNALKAMMDETGKNLAKAQRQGNKGGPITLEMSRSVVSKDGGTVPPHANDTVTITGVTYNGLCDIEDDLADSAKSITQRLGRPHADKKDKGHGGGQGGGQQRGRN